MHLFPTFSVPEAVWSRGQEEVGADHLSCVPPGIGLMSSGLTATSCPRCSLSYPCLHQLTQGPLLHTTRGRQQGLQERDVGAVGPLMRDPHFGFEGAFPHLLSPFCKSFPRVALFDVHWDLSGRGRKERCGGMVS